jgi:alpha-maltose-1-phosphate synthase
MHIVHLLRKYNPAEWGGTETVVHRLFQGMREHRVNSVVYCPRLTGAPAEKAVAAGADLLAKAGCAIKRYRACVPIWGISEQQRRQLVAVGGNLMSFDLIRSLWKEPQVSLIHSHTLGRLGGIAMTVARQRAVPFVFTIHGGVLDVPPAARRLNQAPIKGWEWGKLFGAMFHSRHLFEEADAIITCNEKEASLLQRKYPRKRIVVQPHGVPAELSREDCREAAGAAYPQIRDRQVLLTVGRIHPEKNQAWLIEQAVEVFRRHPRALLVLAGACTNESYGELVQKQIQRFGFEDRVILTGGLAPQDPALIGLFQIARVMILPSIAEPFGLVIPEAWAAGTAVMANRTSGACSLIKNGENGLLFDVSEPRTFHTAVDQILRQPDLAARLAATGGRTVKAEYDPFTLAGRLKHLYEELIEEKEAQLHAAA